MELSFWNILLMVIFPLSLPRKDVLNASDCFGPVGTNDAVSDSTRKDLDKGPTSMQMIRKPPHFQKLILGSMHSLCFSP